ncbi:hypothetical protein [Halomonas kalidii]|uniref:Uncharacterized protein n=1 Tax=Halomonas kalidii TaxID=3043293 RepID=A0ABT6VL62_9GAMM|nr:hypothetical protein [Halomonas kalidii]MDI5933753.1 hypothetical protein [Halomonas kalidii]
MNEKNEMFNMMQVQNMNCIGMFHNHVSVALSEFIKKIDEWEDIDEIDKLWWKAEFEKHYPEKLRQTTFLLMFGHFEEILYLMASSFNPRAIELDKSSYGIMRYKPYIKDVLGDEFGMCNDYDFIIDAQKIRNSFLHMAGRVSLSDKQEELLRIVNKYPFYSKKQDRVQVDTNGVYALQQAISSLSKKLLAKLN